MLCWCVICPHFLDYKLKLKLKEHLKTLTEREVSASLRVFSRFSRSVCWTFFSSEIHKTYRENKNHMNDSKYETIHIWAQVAELFHRLLKFGIRTHLVWTPHTAVWETPSSGCDSLLGSSSRLAVGSSAPPPEGCRHVRAAGKCPLQAPTVSDG